MPSTYAHYRFGRQILSMLEPSDLEAVLAYPELFQIGLHGPDIFFYHHPLGSSPLKSMGQRMHHESADHFFGPASDALSCLPDRRAGISYLYGFLCHFTLDSSCHPYVERSVRQLHIPHLELESEFDRRLMLHDGLDPLNHFPAGHIIPSAPNAGVIAAFFPDASLLQVQESLCSMRTCCRLLLTPHAPKRLLLQMSFALSRNGASLRGILISPHGNPACIPTNLQLGRLYHKALPLAVSLIGNYRLFLKGQAQLVPYFVRSFD